MQTAAITSRFLTGCSSQVGLADSENVVSRSDLLRHIVAKHLVQTVHSQELFVKLTNELIRFAEQAYFARNVDALDEVELRKGSRCSYPLIFPKLGCVEGNGLITDKKGTLARIDPATNKVVAEIQVPAGSFTVIRVNLDFQAIV